jgi:hypothetical protein
VLRIGSQTSVAPVRPFRVPGSRRSVALAIV